MPLTTCPDCGHRVSTSAASCPSCGSPMQAGPVGKRIVTTQRTGKFFKFIQLVGAGLSIWGVIKMMTSGNADSDAAAIGVGLVTVGIVVFLFGRITGWWVHG